MHTSDEQWWKKHSADYVLGLLSSPERLVFERVLLAEPEVQELVIEWREILQPMADALPPVQPADHVLPALISNLPIDNTGDFTGSYDSQERYDDDDNSLDADGLYDKHDELFESSELAGTDMVVVGSNSEQTQESNLFSHQPDNLHKEQLKAHANADLQADGTAFMQLLETKQEQADSWRSFAGLATAACLIVGTLGWMGAQKSNSPSSSVGSSVDSSASSSVIKKDQAGLVFDGMSVVQTSDAQALWIVDTAADAKTLRVTAVAPPELEEDKAFELWMVKPDNGGVVSMGLLPATTNASVQINAHRYTANAESFSVSVEPAQGSPESIPTGPVLYHGKIQALSQ